MTTVSKPKRNPASAEVMAQKKMRPLKPWDGFEVCVGEVMFMFMSKAFTAMAGQKQC
jgi:hypothetical protein